MKRRPRRAGVAGVLAASLLLGASSSSTSVSSAGTREIPGSCRKLLAAPPAPPHHTPFSLTNATVLTMSKGQGRSDTVSIEDGKIVSTSQDAVSSIDLEGATVLPGFIDSHSHWIGDKGMVGYDNERTIASALKWGWTSISELFVSYERLAELCRLEADGTLRLKVGAFLPLNYQMQRFGNWYDEYEPREEFGPHIFLQGLKFFADGAPDGLGNQTDSPGPDVQGDLFWKPGGLKAEFERANDAGWQIAIHATGDGGLDLVLDAFSTLGRKEIVAGRHRIEHLTTVRDDQIKPLRQLGLIGSIQLSFFHAEAAKTLVRWVGRDRVHLTGRWRDLIDAGIPIAGSTDRPFAIAGRSGPSITAIAEAVTRRSPSGKRPPPWMRRQRITVDEALRSITIDAAFARGREDSLGSIEPGKAADLVILSDDPTQVAPKALWDITVVATIVDGRVEYCADSVPTDLMKVCPEESRGQR